MVNKFIKISFALLIILLMLYLYNFNFLFFHSLVELFSIVIAFNIFIISWNSRNFTDNKMLLTLGIAYLSVGFMDSLHLLTFEGVGIFTDINIDLTTKFWISARYLESLSFIFAGLFSLKKRKIKAKVILAIYITITTILFICIVSFNLFPECYVESTGLTPFKIYSEYFICIIFALAGIIFWLNRVKFQIDLKVLYLFLASIMFSVISEICFTLYKEIESYPQYLGHMFKLISFYLIYKALVEESLRKPYATLFKNHNISQKKLIATGSMISTMFHDIKNPLTNIRAISQIGSISTDSCKDKEFYTRIIQHVDNITGMINKINHAMGSNNLQEVDPALSLKEVVDEVQTICRSKNIKLEMDSNKSVNKVLLEENLFKRVIYNIINNAVRVLEENSLIQIKLEEIKNDILIAISDNGPGIAPELQDDIFKPYTSESGSTGLGLYMVHFVVTQIFGGKVWFKSKKSKGTTFYIKLPAINKQG